MDRERRFRRDREHFFLRIGMGVHDGSEYADTFLLRLRAKNLVAPLAELSDAQLANALVEVKPDLAANMMGVKREARPQRIAVAPDRAGMACVIRQQGSLRLILSIAVIPSALLRLNLGAIPEARFRIRHPGSWPASGPVGRSPLCCRSGARVLPRAGRPFCPLSVAPDLRWK